MYKVYCDGRLMYDPRSKNLSLIEPTLELALNSAGSFSFSMVQNHPFYDKIKNMKSVISVEKDGKEIFSGRVIQPGKNFFNTKSFVCEGELAYLNDTIQRHKEYHNISVENYLKDVIAIHNAQVDASKQFTVGNVTVIDSNDSIYKISNYENTWQLLNDKLLGAFGGYFFVRKENGIRYIDYLAEMPGTCSQVIQFGKNLLDFSSNIELTDIATALIPLGAAPEGSEERLTVASVNGGSDVIVSNEAVQTYGYICKTIEWSDVTLPSNLLRKGQEYLSSIQWENMLLNVKAVDLHDLDVNIEAISIGDEIRVYSVPHGLDRFFPVSALSIKLDNPSDNSISLGIEVSANKQTTRMSAVEKSVDDVKGNVDELQDEIEEINETIGKTEVRLEKAEDGLTAEVSRATSAEETISASLALKIGEDDTGKLISMLEAIADNISFTANKKFTIDSNNFTVDEDGKMKCSSAEITGGSINIETSYDSEDKIVLIYDGSKVKISPSELLMTNYGAFIPISGGQMNGYTKINRGELELGYYKRNPGAAVQGISTILVDALAGTVTAPTFSGNLSGNLTGSAGSVHVGSNGLIPDSNGTMRLGGPGYKWSEVFAGTGTINTSDRKEKKSIESLNEKHMALFEKLMPVSFQFIDGTSGRTHIGFISQDVELAMAEVGLSDLDFAGFCKDEITDEDGNVKTIYGLRYSEFIALNTMMIQRTRNELSNLKEILKEKGVI